MENLCLIPKCSYPAPKMWMQCVNNCPWQVPLIFHTIIPCVRANKASEVVSCGSDWVWYWGLKLPPLDHACTVRIMKYKIKERGLSTKQLPFFPREEGENLRTKAEARRAYQEMSLSSRAMEVWYLHCFFTTALKIPDCRLELPVLWSWGQHFGEAVIYTQMHVSWALTRGTVIKKPVCNFYTERCRK